jgi:hypothetical protein
MSGTSPSELARSHWRAEELSSAPPTRWIDAKHASRCCIRPCSGCEARLLAAEALPVEAAGQLRVTRDTAPVGMSAMPMSLPDQLGGEAWTMGATGLQGGRRPTGVRARVSSHGDYGRYWARTSDLQLVELFRRLRRLTTQDDESRLQTRVSGHLAGRHREAIARSRRDVWATTGPELPRRADTRGL